MINFKNATYIKSTPDIKNAPKDGYPEFLFVGKSNVGKSTLINLLTSKKKLAYVSKKPGHTKYLNYYNIDNKIFLVDAPGYGYAKGNIDLDKLFFNMMNDYFTNVKNLKIVFLLLDSRREITDDDINLINFFVSKNIDYRIIFTKRDKINQSEMSKLIKSLKELNIDEKQINFTSSLTPRSIIQIQKMIESAI